MSAPANLEGDFVKRLDAKRLDFGVELVSACPGCGTERRDRLILDYPVVNAPTSVHRYCPVCEEEWSVRVRINVSVEVLP